MIVKNLKTTKADRRYFSEKAKINQAANDGRLGRSWFQVNPETGKTEVKPKAISNRV